MTEGFSELLVSTRYQYVDEVGFLWSFRQIVRDSWVYQLPDILEVDQRLEANIDGLTIAGETGWKCCEENLSFDEPGEIFTATINIVESGKLKRLEQVFAVAQDRKDLLDAMAGALSWGELKASAPFLKLALQSDNPAWNYVATETMTQYGQFSPMQNKVLTEALSSDNPLLLIAALRSIVNLGLVDYSPLLKPLLDNDDESVKFLTACGLTRFGDPKGLDVMKQFCEHPEHYEQALRYITMQSNTDDTIQVIKTLFKSNKRIAHIALGMLGDIRSIPQLIESMKVPELARCAGGAFSDITGVNIEEKKLDAEWPEGFEAGPTENPEDEDVAMDPDEDLPWPDVEKITAWWKSNHSQFDPAKLYICGMPKKKSSFEQVLREGNQKQRAYAANALGLYERDKPIFNVYAPAKRQMQLLGLN